MLTKANKGEQRPKKAKIARYGKRWQKKGKWKQKQAIRWQRNVNEGKKKGRKTRFCWLEAREGKRI